MNQEQSQITNANLVKRPPIVTVLGHVDHGKTTLLDSIRKSNIASREAGGITQKIGASQVSTKEGNTITFIDTPGHAAFSQMRSRGAKVADIAILVVASDDGVKPQTSEAIKHIKEAKIPFIVAFTKVDLPTASVESVFSQLEKEEIYFENRGGQTPWLAVSAKTNKGIDELLELISLIAEVEDIKGSPEAELEAVVIETFTDKRGPVASVVVRNGSIKVGDIVFFEGKKGKIRGLFDHKGVSIKEVKPGEAAALLGFEQLPPVGTKIGKKEDMADAGEKKKQRIIVGEGQIPVLVKAQNAGALEAVLSGLPQELAIVQSGVGDINESDILLARASGAQIILAFESKTSSGVQKLAEAEGIQIHSFPIIYELFQKAEEMVKAEQVEILGRAEILATFPYESRKVAGCKVVNGQISKQNKLLLTREDKTVGEVNILSIRKQKTEVNEVKAGEECGILFVPQLDFGQGDMLVSVRK